MTTYHVKMKIETVLSLDDQQLIEMFGATPSLIREQLEQDKANGEIYIGSEGCEGFCPINGCPGHKKS